MTYRRKAGNTKRRAKVASIQARSGKKKGTFKAARSYYAIAHCAKHDKFLYSTRAKAKAAIRMHHEPGMREYPCEVQPDHWHVGHLPKPVRRGKTTAPRYYQPPLSPPKEQEGPDMTTDIAWTSENGHAPLTRAITPLDIRPLNGKDKPIEVLLVEAEASDDPRIRTMAAAIRAQVFELRTELKTSQAERELMEKIEAMRSDLSAAMAALADLRRDREPSPPPMPEVAIPAYGGQPSGSQAEIRAWCAAQVPPVACHPRGSIQASARAAYERAHGIPND